MLASKVRTKIAEARTDGRLMAGPDGFNYSTTRMVNKYLAGKKQLAYGAPRDVFPVDLIDLERPAAAAADEKAAI